MLPYRALDLLPFVPSGGDYEAALRFAAALGFETEWQHDGYTGLRIGGAVFVLQRFEDPAVQQQTMLTLTVDDLDAFHAHVAALDLPRLLPGVRMTPPTDFPWGREVHLIDPAGVCWHVRQRAAPRAIRPVILTGEHVRLEPLARKHVDALAPFALDEDLWRWTTSALRSRADLEAYVAAALADAARGVAMPFVTIARGPATAGSPHGAVAGATRFGNVELAHGRVEIGWTFVGRPWQRTAVNTEAKLLMLRHAFGALGCRRVELRTDALNTRSRAAILRLGAVEEGVLRRHMVTSTGRIRDTVVHALTDVEWTEAERRLAAALRRGSNAPGAP